MPNTLTKAENFDGRILGYTTVGIDASSDYHTLVNATMTVVDDAMKVKFVAPPSGVIEIFASLYFDAARRIPVLGLSDQDTGDTYRAISFPNAIFLRKIPWFLLFIVTRLYSILSLISIFCFTLCRKSPILTFLI